MKNLLLFLHNFVKPKDLKAPFSWKDRKVLLSEHMLFVPDYYQNYDCFTLPLWSSLFGNTNSVHIEYCSGNGAWISNKAQEEPNINWVAVEKRFDRCRKIWSKMHNLNLTNLFIICSDGFTVTKHYFNDDSIKNIFINFPDPWPKNRHAKHRIIQDSFVQEINRILSLHGTITCVTDDNHYSKQIINTIHQNPHFKPLYQHPYFVTDISDYGNSYFKDLWEAKKKNIYYMTFIKHNCN